MKYAKEVIDLMAAYPGRKFKMRHIVNYVAPGASTRQKASIREGVRRVVLALEESGQISSTREEVPNGSDAEYWWKPQHQELSTRNGNRHNIPQDNCAYSF
ncbi:hypothetical protein CSC67_08615 [Pusillimonas caeni]|uniref:hypothetical protein n=1 Tax=Pusillimonas caeni TaxID=1348472 RepID=UPI000E59D04F|nr:hypothetical protein [Pusillimonas caeni]TFL14204.1 hypothetical protein CSC67_08615 [Pusillimonas caeni]